MAGKIAPLFAAILWRPFNGECAMLKSVTLAAALALASGLSPAGATPLSPGLAPPSLSHVEAVELRRYPWSPGQPASRYRHGPYTVYRDGWWYVPPLVYVPRPDLQIETGNDAYDRYYRQYYSYVDTGYGDAHVEWCFDHYRSYDPDLDTFVGHDGEHHPCRSPYD
jgi:hypothetical protein